MDFMAYFTMGTGGHYITMLPADWSISTSHDPLPSSYHSKKMLWNPSIAMSHHVLLLQLLSVILPIKRYLTRVYHWVISMSLGRAWASPTLTSSTWDVSICCCCSVHLTVNHFRLLFCTFLRHLLIQKLFTNSSEKTRPSTSLMATASHSWTYLFNG